MKPKRIWLYLGEVESNELDLIMDIVGTPLKETDVLGMIAAAGLKAIADQDYKIELPLQFKVVREPRPNDPPPRPKTAKKECSV